MKAKDEGDKTPGKTTLISSSLGAGIGRRFKNETRKTCSYVKRGATINRISNDLGINDGYKDSDKIVFFQEQMIWLTVHLGRLLFHMTIY